MKHSIQTVAFIFIFGVASYIRFWLADLPYNADIANYLIDLDIFHSGGNIYRLQQAYNYSPAWYWILGAIDTIRLTLFPHISFPFVIRLFLSVVDIVTLTVLMHIAHRKNISILWPAALFYLNPVSMIISAKHGQFDNVALLFLLLAWVAWYYKQPRLIWFFGTIALLVKHIILFPLIALYWSVWGMKRGSVALVGSLGLFFLSFIPYISAWREIIRHVFMYGGVPGAYGISSILTWMYQLVMHPSAVNMNTQVTGIPVSVRGLYVVLTVITICTNVVFVYFMHRRVSVWQSMMLSILFFLATTTGVGIQYFVLPLIFAWANRKIPVVIYTIVVTLFFIGSTDEFGISQFSFISWNIVWGTIIGWLLYEKYQKQKRPYLL